MNLVTVELAHAINDVNGFKEPTLLIQPMSEIVQIQPQSKDDPHVGWYRTKPNVSHPYGSSSKGRISPGKSCPSLNDTPTSDTMIRANQYYIAERHFGVFKADY
jgi:hypothetical protein